eukprot:2709791-Rhodomonas_salina.1
MPGGVRARRSPSPLSSLCSSSTLSSPPHRLLRATGLQHRVAPYARSQYNALVLHYALSRRWYNRSSWNHDIEGQYRTCAREREGWRSRGSRFRTVTRRVFPSRAPSRAPAPLTAGTALGLVPPYRSQYWA